jgi:hypothetical protein
MFGQAICTSVDCDSGKASIDEMDAVFQSLPINLQSRYQSAHDGIMAAFQKNYSWYDQIFGAFSPSCCTIQQLGNQADGLTAQMQAALGQIPVGVGGPGTQSQPIPFLSGLLGGSNTSLLLIGGLIVAYFVLKK